MNELGLALVGLAVGLAVGVAVAVGLRTNSRAQAAPDRTAEVIEGRLGAQGAGLRRLGHAGPGPGVSDFRVNGKVVEYGLLLPDGRRLPVDSKWSAVRELEALEEAEDSSERELLAREVERVVAGGGRGGGAGLE